MFDAGDVLLYVLSSWRQTSWTTFRRSFDELHRRQLTAGHSTVLGDAALFRFRTLRMLASLGHVEMGFGPTGAGTVTVSNSALVALPGPGIRKAVLVGARSPAFVERLRKASSGAAADFAVHPQGTATPFAPACIEIQAPRMDTFEMLAKSIGVPFMKAPPARAIGRWSGSVSEYLAKLTWSPDDNVNWYREDFDPVSLRFVGAVDEPAPVRLSRYQDPVRETWRYRFFREGQFASIDPDWGRYAILSHHKRQAVEFDPTSSSVRVPTRAPLPVLLSRALALCSGRSPVPGRSVDTNDRSFGLRYDVYQAIPPSVASVVAHKVGQ